MSVKPAHACEGEGGGEYEGEGDDSFEAGHAGESCPGSLVSEKIAEVV